MIHIVLHITMELKIGCADKYFYQLTKCKDDITFNEIRNNFSSFH